MWTRCVTPGGNWKLKRQQQQKIKDVTFPPEAAQVTASSCLLLWDYRWRNLSPFFPQHNLKASRTSHMEPVCANRNKHRVRLYPKVSKHANSVQTYKCILRFCFPWIVGFSGKQPAHISISCCFTFWLTPFILLEGKNLNTVSPSWMSCWASEVFSKDKSQKSFRLSS